jgi:RNA polymerase sigma-70 factor (ECF subfamily)
MDELIRIYWKPLYFFVRQKGFDNETAKDIVQEFLADVLERGTITKADPERGRFRTFLLTAISNFVKDRHKASHRLKRGGGQSLLSLDFDDGERQFAMEVAGGETPETVLNRAWARGMLDQCISELTGNESHLLAFEMLMQGADYAEIVKETGLSLSAAKTGVLRLRRQLKELLLNRMAESGETPDDAELAMADLAALLR